mmetsp:Transcript_41769/g.67760  ORF Transcript_41769/g.67760 Transcript_41769/m.67760 type:complete len:82 (+) Transcript_41769:2-247(+)
MENFEQIIRDLHSARQGCVQQVQGEKTLAWWVHRLLGTEPQEATILGQNAFAAVIENRRGVLERTVEKLHPFLSNVVSGSI